MSILDEPPGRIEMNLLIDEKLKQAAGLLEEGDADLWLTLVRESSRTHDPILDYIFEGHVVWPSAFMVTRSREAFAIVGSLDASSVESLGTYKVIPYVQSFRESFLPFLEKLGPKKILINYSSETATADGMTHGMYLYLQEILQGTPFRERLHSSQELIGSLIGRKSQEEVGRIQRAIDATLGLFEEVTRLLKPGMTEKEVAAYLSQRIEENRWKPAWDVETCPAVFSGPQKGGAHSSPTDKAIQRGEVVNIDFGLMIDGYVSDLQRSWYLLAPGEKEPPEGLKKAFRVLIDSVDLAVKALKPGVKGVEIDSLTRNHITSQGYPEFPHALGHQVGRCAHDGVALLAPPWERYGNIPELTLEEGMVFTVEPRISLPQWGVVTVEEIVKVTPQGGVYLSKPQKELILVG